MLPVTDLEGEPVDGPGAAALDTPASLAPWADLHAPAVAALDVAGAATLGAAGGIGTSLCPASRVLPRQRSQRCGQAGGPSRFTCVFYSCHGVLPSAWWCYRSWCERGAAARFRPAAG